MQVKVTIKGVTPILMNMFHDANEINVSSGISSVSISGKGTPREQAEKKKVLSTSRWTAAPWSSRRPGAESWHIGLDWMSGA